ncbi:MAG: hypothetical protein J6S60_06705 [Oscillospiraceae bacterium]|nr:hypothetical protein [Oscillospiraceae bacterium]
MYENLIFKLDGSYDFLKNGRPYNCPNFGEWTEEFAQVDAWAKEHPEQVQHEQPAPAPTLDELKEAKLAELEDSFDTRVSGSFVCSQGWPMQFNRSDTLAVEGAIQLLKATEQTAGYLTDANDATHYGVPLATMEAVKVEMLAAYAQCHAQKQELRAAINAAITEEELNAVTINWPV